MMSIRRKLILGLLLGLMTLLVVSGTILYSYINTVLSSQFDSALIAEAHVVCSFVELHHGKIKVEVPQEPISQLGPGAGLQYFQIWREDGTVLMRSPALGKNDLPHTNATDTPVLANIELPQGRAGKTVLLSFMPVAEHKDKEEEEEEEHEKDKDKSLRPAGQKVIVAVAQDRSELNRIMTVLFSALLGIAAFMALGVVAVVSVGVRQGLSPLQRVADDAAKIDAESLDFRFSINGLPSELQPICLRLNDSLERLKKAFERERRFTADVAHELRTPIAELRSLADVALKWEGDRKTSLGYFTDARDIAQQMERIVTTLLSLARCQLGTMTVVCESITLDTLVDEAWNGHQQEAAKRHLAVTFDLPERLVLKTDRTMLYSIVSNLIANAVHYTRISGKVACKAIANSSGVQFMVTNDIDSLSPDDLPHFFEAFWRKDDARTDSLHCGLGLTLVDAYATALGGKVEVSLQRQDSICIAVHLPTAGQ